MSTNSQGLRIPFVGTRRSSSPPSVDAQPPLKKPRMDSNRSQSHGIALSTLEHRAIDPSMATVTEEAPLDDVNAVSTATEIGPSVSKHASSAANPRKKQSRKKKQVSHEPASPGDVLWHEVQRLVGADVAKGIVEVHQGFASPFKFGDEVVVDVLEVSAGGTPKSLIYTMTHEIYAENSKVMG